MSEFDIPKELRTIAQQVSNAGGVVDSLGGSNLAQRLEIKLTGGQREALLAKHSGDVRIQSMQKRLAKQVVGGNRAALTRKGLDATLAGIELEKLFNPRNRVITASLSVPGQVTSPDQFARVNQLIDQFGPPGPKNLLGNLEKTLADSKAARERFAKSTAGRAAKLGLKLVPKMLAGALAGPPGLVVGGLLSISDAVEATELISELAGSEKKKSTGGQMQRGRSSKARKGLLDFVGKQE